MEWDGPFVNTDSFCKWVQRLVVDYLNLYHQNGRGLATCDVTEYNGVKAVFLSGMYTQRDSPDILQTALCCIQQTYSANFGCYGLAIQGQDLYTQVIG
jgi:hypothetical protein